MVTVDYSNESQEMKAALRLLSLQLQDPILTGRSSFLIFVVIFFAIRIIFFSVVCIFNYVVIFSRSDLLPHEICTDNEIKIELISYVVENTAKLKKLTVSSFVALAISVLHCSHGNEITAVVIFSIVSLE